MSARVRDGKRRSRAADETTQVFQWDAGWNVINDEDDAGNLQRTFFHGARG